MLGYLHSNCPEGAIFIQNVGRNQVIQFLLIESAATALDKYYILYSKCTTIVLYYSNKKRAIYPFQIYVILNSLLGQNVNDEISLAACYQQN